MNPALIALGEKIHDALRRFSLVSGKKDWIHLNLSGGCAIGSYFLVTEAEKLGIPAVFMRGSAHCWAESEGYIYDVTALQYMLPQVTCLGDLDLYPKVRVMAIREVESPTFCDRVTEDKLLWGAARYRTRNTWFDNTPDNVESLNGCWPQGQRIRGFHLEWNGDKARIFWRGKHRTIG